MSQIALLVTGILPLMASALIYIIHLVTRKVAGTPYDGAEKQTLALMILPILIGAGFLMLARVAPTIMTSSLPDMSAGEEGAWAPARYAMLISHAKIDWLKLALNGVGVLYIAVAGILALRLLVAQWRLWKVVRATTHMESEVDVRITMAVVPAFAWQRQVILPQSLIAGLSRNQLVMVIAHERAHVVRGDTSYYALLSWLDVVFWFNPFIRQQTTRCRLAAELACDAMVTQANPEMRQDYAASLLLALKHTAGNALPILTQSSVPAAISPSNSGEFKMRLTEIMRASGTGRKRGRWIAQIAAAALVVSLAGGQFMLSQNPARANMTVAIAGATVFSVMPVQGEVTSPFGLRISPLDGKRQFHEGVDFRATIGTPVYAPAAGRVVTIKTDSWNGLTLEVDHGDGYITRYTHLNKITIGDKASVNAGQQIAEVGSSGKNTGAHLHFVVFKDGKPIDPVTVLPKLQGHADASVALFANNMDRRPDGVTKAWGSVEVHLGSRVIHADNAIYDPAARTLIADGKPIDLTAEAPAVEF